MPVPLTGKLSKTLNYAWLLLLHVFEEACANDTRLLSEIPQIRLLSVGLCWQPYVFYPLLDRAAVEQTQNSKLATRLLDSKMIGDALKHVVPVRDVLLQLRDRNELPHRLADLNHQRGVAVDNVDVVIVVLQQQGSKRRRTRLH